MRRYYSNKINRAYAYIKGSTDYPQIKGVVEFQDKNNGVLVMARIFGLPNYKPGTETTPPIGPFGFHIHEKGSCKPQKNESFSEAGGHYNPNNQPHGNHAGDFPVLFSNDGYAFMIFYTNKIKIKDIIGRAVIIHENPDDYRTQPAGDAGARIACGIIEK